MDETFEKVAELLQNNTTLSVEEKEQLDLVLFSCIVYRNALTQLANDVTEDEESGNKLFTQLVNIHIDGVENGYEHCTECGNIYCSDFDNEDETLDDEKIIDIQKEYIN